MMGARPADLDTADDGFAGQAMWPLAQNHAIKCMKM